jgi:small GTP-binding protein
MIRKKICMLGAFAVGKTSLVRRFVKSIFDEKYLTTLGVKVDKKTLQVDDQEVMLMLWDLEGQDIFSSINTSYVRGASGYLLVADGTRRETLMAAIDIRRKVNGAIGKIPFAILLNKSDLKDDWELKDEDVSQAVDSKELVMVTSAKTGEGVEEAFLALARKMLEGPARA